MPWSPDPAVVAPSGSKPTPSSRTSNSSSPSSCCSRIVTVLGFAYFATFWTASSTQK